MKQFLTAFLGLIIVIGCEKKSTNGNGNGNGEEVGCIIEEQFATVIQDQIDAASDGDTILVQPGTYTGSINFNGKNIVVGSLYLTTGDESYIFQTVIDGNSSGSVVRFENGETSSAVLSGFSIKNGLAYQGGGIYIKNSGPTLDHLVIFENEVEGCVEGKVTVTASGGGIYCYQSDAILQYVTVRNNLSGAYGGGVFLESSNDISIMNLNVHNNTAAEGGGIFFQGSSPTVLRTYVGGNVAETGAGGGVYLKFSNPTMINCTVIGNSAETEGGGIFCSSGSPELTNFCITGNSASRGGGLYLNASTVMIMNTVLWGNSQESMYFNSVGLTNSLNISYTNIEGGVDGIEDNDNGTITWGEGNLNEDPGFGGGHVLCDDSMGCDFELVGGVIPEGSHMIDAGNPNSIYNDSDGSRNDMGAHGGPTGDCSEYSPWWWGQP